MVSQRGFAIDDFRVARAHAFRRETTPSAGRLEDGRSTPCYCLFAFVIVVVSRVVLFNSRQPCISCLPRQENGEQADRFPGHSASPAELY